MIRSWRIFCSVLVGLVFVSSYAGATGISVDAGLTPAEDRWIFRSILHTMQRDDDPTTMDRKMKKYTLNTVLAYGLQPKLTFMLKLPAVHREMMMAGSTNRDTGLADLFLLATYGIYRRNTREYTFGVATTLGLELPTGADAFTSDTWDVKPGLYLSLRRGPWGSDFNIDYAWNGFADESSSGIDPGDELSVDWAFAHQFSMGEKANVALAPVLELSYKHISPHQSNGNNLANTGEEVLFLSPGIKYTKSSLILEALIQFPVWQDQEGSQLKRGTGGLVGIRYMF
jgi:hypothetical protein